MKIKQSYNKIWSHFDKKKIPLNFCLLSVDLLQKEEESLLVLTNWSSNGSFLVGS